MSLKTNHFISTGPGSLWRMIFSLSMKQKRSMRSRSDDADTWVKHHLSVSMENLAFIIIINLLIITIEPPQYFIFIMSIGILEHRDLNLPWPYILFIVYYVLFIVYYVGRISLDYPIPSRFILDYNMFKLKESPPEP